MKRVFLPFITGCFVTLLLTLSPATAQSPKMQETLQKMIDETHMPGVVSILATKDRVLQIDCVGYADIENQVPMAPNQLFWIASTTKFFTGTALMMLVDEGKVALDDPIDKYLPEMANNLRIAEEQDGVTILRKPDSIPTIRHCLSHQGGWPFLTDMMMQFGGDSLPLRKAVFDISRTPIQFQPGTGFNYTELGIDVVGAIIEIVSGMPYEQFLQERIFTPLEMNDTTLWPSKEVQENQWISHYTEGNQEIHKAPVPIMTPPYEDKFSRFPEPGSCLFSTANDLTKFFQMHAGNGVYQGKRYLSEESIKEMRTNQSGAGYGITSQLESKWYGHGGACGNVCQASNDGLVRIFVVQVTSVQGQYETLQAWKDTADEIFQENGYEK